MGHFGMARPDRSSRVWILPRHRRTNRLSTWLLGQALIFEVTGPSIAADLKFAAFWPRRAEHSRILRDVGSSATVG